MGWRRNPSHKDLQRASHEVLANPFVHDVTQEVAVAVPAPCAGQGAFGERSRNVSRSNVSGLEIRPMPKLHGSW